MSWLVIGIGNTLRRDDGLGPWLAERIAEWRLPNVSTRVVHQLTPELAVEIAEHGRILFLDASQLNDDAILIEISASAGATRWGHAARPGEVLAWADSLGAGPRRAWLAAVPGSDFDFGEGLSANAAEAGERALACIARLLQEDEPCMKSG